MAFPKVLIVALLVMALQANVVFSEDEGEDQPLTLIFQKPSIILDADAKLNRRGAYGESSRFTLEQRLHRLEQNNIKFQDKVTRLEEKVHHQNRQLALAKEEINLLMNVESSSSEVVIPIRGMPKSCSDLMRIGHKLSGIYSVMGPNKQTDSLYCDFTKRPTNIGFQTKVNAPISNAPVLDSSPVVFYVQRNTSFKPHNVAIPFEIEILNAGGAMDLPSGIFTAPRAGIYFFSFSGYSFVKNLYVGLYVNDIRIATGYSQTTYDTFIVQSALQLKAADKVSVRIWLGSYLLDDNRRVTHFTGLLLHTVEE